MGLDMYLEEEVYLSQYVDKDGLYDDVKKALKTRTEESIKCSITIGYWRKANAIHKWFVDNIQDGVDECQRSYVSSEDLAELYEACQTVLDSIKTEDGEVHIGTRYSGGEREVMTREGKVITNPTVAEQTLPTASGFFFGGTHYDEFYINELERTIDILDEIRNEDGSFGREGRTYYYQASW